MLWLLREAVCRFHVCVCVLVISCFISGCRNESRSYRFSDQYLNGGSYIGSNPVVMPDGRALLFGYPSRDSVGDICSINVDGTCCQVIIGGPYYQGQADISADGNIIAYVSEEDGAPHIYLADRNGSNKRRLTRGEAPEHSPIISFDGTRIAFVRRYLSGKEDVIMCAIDGGLEICVTNDSVSAWPVCFSSDNDSLYYLSGGSHGFNLRRNRFMLHVDEPVIMLGLDGAACAVTKDEKRVVFVDDREKPFAFDVYTCPIDGGPVRQLTHFGGYIGNVRIGHDAAETVSFVVESKRDGAGDIYLLDIEEGIPRRIGSNYMRRYGP